MNETTLTQMLAKKHQSPAWAFLAQVRNSTGGSRIIRTADALAMSLWPSRGLELHGFEIKSRRSDWLSELKKPAKAEEISRFCHRWWIVAPKDVVQVSELPSPWGLMVPRGQGLTTVKQAELREPESITWQFFAALMRNATENSTPNIAIEEKMRGRFDDGVEVGRHSAEQLELTYRRMKKEVKDFEAASGLKICAYDGGDELGRLVSTIRGLGRHGLLNKIKRDRIAFKGILEGMESAISEMEEPSPACSKS